MKIPKQAIEFIVNRFHVGTPDEAIATDIRRRVRSSRAAGVTQACETAMVSYALKVHHKNQAMYNHVMGGLA
jgi:hypothetical protein